MKHIFTGAVGPNAELMAVATAASVKLTAEMTASAPPPPNGLPPVNEGTFEIEDLRVTAKSGKEAIYPNPNPNTGAGKYRLWEADGAGDSISFALTPPKAGRLSLKVYFFNQNNPGSLQLQVDGKDVGAPVSIAQGMEFKGLNLDNTKDQVLTLKLVGLAGVGHTNVRFDRLDLLP